MHIDRIFDNLFRSRGGYLFDVNAAFFRNHHNRGLRITIKDNAEVVFLFDVYLGSDEDFFYFQPLDIHTQHSCSRRTGLLRCITELDTARFAASTDIDLCLDDHWPTQFTGNGFSLLWRMRYFPRLYWNPITSQYIFRLIFVDFHKTFSPFCLAKINALYLCREPF